VVIGPKGNDGWRQQIYALKNKVMKMADCSYNNFEQQQEPQGSAGENLPEDEDLVMEKILENINNTPIGQVLKKIAALPEVRKEKVLNVRHQLTEGQYDVNKRLDIALDKVLEDLVM
jgi:hypothetical protein